MLLQVRIAAAAPFAFKGEAGARHTARGGAFLGIAATLFVASAAATIAGSVSMAAMGATPMPGGWTLSTMWAPMCGQTWFSTAVSFLVMWTAMMAAMMLPSVGPGLWRYRGAMSDAGSSQADRLTTIVGAGYFAVWAAVGVLVFPFGAALAAIEMQSSVLARAVPLAAGVVVLLAGAVQLTTWKARHLACCRAGVPHVGSSTGACTGWSSGVRLGLHCIASCAPMMTILLAVGVMDVRAMAAVTVAITAERLAPDGVGTAPVVGIVAMAAGWVMVAREIVLA